MPIVRQRFPINPTQEHERQMRRYESLKQAQRFVSVHGVVNNLFRRVATGDVRLPMLEDKTSLEIVRSKPNNLTPEIHLGARCHRVTKAIFSNVVRFLRPGYRLAGAPRNGRYR
jgi:hypothetical protein